MIVHVALVLVGIGIGWMLGISFAVGGLKDDIAVLDAEREQLHEEWQALAEQKGSPVTRPNGDPTGKRLLGARLLGIHISKTSKVA